MSDWDVVSTAPVDDGWEVADHSQPIAGSAEDAFLNGLTLGAGPDAVQGGLESVEAVNPKIAVAIEKAGGSSNPADAAAQERAAIANYAKTNPMASALATAGGSALTTTPLLGAAGGLEQAALRGLPAAARFVEGAGSGIAKIPSLLFSGAKTGAEAAAIQSGTNDESLEDQLKTGAETGGAMGAGAPLLRYLSTPFGKYINPMVSAAVDRARSLGLDINLTQMLPDLPKFLQTGTTEGQLGTVTKLVNQQMGSTESSLTPETVTAARSAISQRFKDLEPHIQIDPNNQDLLNSLADVDTAASAKWPHGSEKYTNVKNTIDEIFSDLHDAQARTVPGSGVGGQNMLPPPGGMTAPAAGIQGTVPGIRYFALTERGGPIDQLIHDNATNEFGVKLRQALDSAVDKDSDPNVLSDLEDARSQWKASLVAEKLAGQGQTSTHGQVDPTKIKDAVRQVYGMYGWGPDGTPLATLGDVGGLLNKPTAQGAPGGGHLASLGRLGLGAIGFEALHDLGASPEHAAMGAGAAIGALGARKATQAYINSPLYRNMLANPGELPPDLATALGVGLANSTQSR